MNKPHRLLALDSAGAACSAAVWSDDGLAARRFAAMARGQSECLVPMIEAVMAEAGLDYAALDAIAVTRGPGGFTGVRIGLATARGLALACDAPLVGVTNFEAVVSGVPAVEAEGRAIVVVLESKRHEVYLQVFDPDHEPLSSPCLIAPEDAPAVLPPGPLLLLGDAQDRLHDALGARDWRVSEAPSLSDAGLIAALAAARPLPAAGEPLPAPLYLRTPDVTQPVPMMPPGSPRDVPRDAQP